tara:strand:+ start:1286 stop:1408 length:123 start_codon:yes stop_codon:yes gene_type:complete
MLYAKGNKYNCPGVSKDKLILKPMTRAPFDPNKELRSKTV